MKNFDLFAADLVRVRKLHIRTSPVIVKKMPPASWLHKHSMKGYHAKTLTDRELKKAYVANQLANYALRFSSKFSFKRTPAHIVSQAASRELARLIENEMSIRGFSFEFSIKVFQTTQKG